VETRSPHVLQTMRIPLSMSAFGSNVILINDRNKLAISIETAGVDRPIAPLLRSNCGCVLRPAQMPSQFTPQAEESTLFHDGMGRCCRSTMLEA
jgi:hypothetical protein